MDPDDAEALNHLGYMLADRNLRLEEALRLITRAVDKNPESGAYIDSLGWVYFRLGRQTDAENQLRRAVLKLPDNPIVLDHLAETLMRQGKFREAIAQWQQALTRSPKDLFPAELAGIRAKVENLGKSLKLESARLYRATSRFPIVKRPGKPRHL